MGGYTENLSLLDKTYGFKRRENRLIQLQKVLHLEENQSEFNIVKDELQSLVDKFMDIDQPTNGQRTALDRIEKELLNKRARVWAGKDGAKKLFFARRAAMAYHFKQRREMLRIKKDQSMGHLKGKHQVQEGEEIVIDLTMDSSSDESLTYEEGSTEEADNSSAPSSATITPWIGQTTQNLNSADPIGGSNAVSDQVMKKRGVHAVGPYSNSHRVRFGPPSKRMNRVPNVHAVNTGTSDKSGIPFLLDFLASCKPPLKRHLHLFVEFGRNANWEVMLRSLSVDWSVEDRKALMREILAGGNKAEPVMELDIAIFENNLKTYFQ